MIRIRHKICGLSVKFWTVVILYGTLFLSLWCIYKYSEPIKWEDDTRDWVTSIFYFMKDGDISSNVERIERIRKESIEYMHLTLDTYVDYVRIGILVHEVLNIMTVVVAIYAVHWNKCYFIIPYLAYYGMWIVGYVFLIFTFIFCIWYVYGGYAALILSPFVIAYLVYIYMWMIVYSLCRERFKSERGGVFLDTKATATQWSSESSS